MKRSATFSAKSAPLLPQEPNDYIPTQTQDEVDNSPPISEHFELKDDNSDDSGDNAINGDRGPSVNE